MPIRPLFSAVLVFTVAFCLPARAGEEAGLDKQPPAVQKTAHEQIGKAPITEVEPAFEAGRHGTEVEYTENGRKMAIVIAPDGTLIQKEHRLSPGDAPDAIKKAVEAFFPGGRISHITQVERGGSTFFEISVKSAGKSHQMKLDTSGKPAS